MTSALNDQSLDQIFRSARTPNGWADRPVEDDTLREIYDLMKWGPTSANSSPARFVWVHSADGKAMLAGLAAAPNETKILKLPSRSLSATIWISPTSYQSFCLTMPRSCRVMEGIGADLEVIKPVPLAAGHIDAIRAIGRERSTTLPT
jgi:nitroreductase